MRRFLSVVVVMSAVFVATGAKAQAPAAPAPAAQAPAAVPDQMPFDFPYGTTIAVDRAAQVVAAMVAEAKKGARNWRIAFAVTDPHGELVYFYKMDDTTYGSIEIAINKARTAARLRRTTENLMNVMNAAGPFFATLDRNFVMATGGYPLIEGGKLIGAVGCSGAAGAQDAVACKAGVDLINK